MQSWDARVPTGRLNTFFKEIVAATPPPVRGGKQPRILFATQATARPPTFVLFTTGFLEAGYRRFLERRLRETFGFEGSPIRINVRVREASNALSLTAQLRVHAAELGILPATRLDGDDWMGRAQGRRQPYVGWGQW